MSKAVIISFNKHSVLQKVWKPCRRLNKSNWSKSTDFENWQIQLKMIFSTDVGLWRGQVEEKWKTCLSLLLLYLFDAFLTDFDGMGLRPDLKITLPCLSASITVVLKTFCLAERQCCPVLWRFFAKVCYYLGLFLTQVGKLWLILPPFSSFFERAHTKKF